MAICLPYAPSLLARSLDAEHLQYPDVFLMLLLHRGKSRGRRWRWRWAKSRKEEGWISEAMQHLRCSVGLLMRAMLRMMELRGLTNFGKREQEEESGGGIWGLLLQPV